MRRLLLLPLLVLLVLLLPDLATAATGSGYGWPLAGTPVLDRGFEPPRTAWGAGHRGVDLQAPVGSPVLAAGPGRVSYAGLLAGRGVVVVVHAGGLRTTYEPVDASVHVDDVVARGDVLGTLTAGHASCRPGTACLHWGLLSGDTYLDPLSLLGLRRVRLLPLHPDAGTPYAGPVTGWATTRAAPAPAARDAPVLAAPPPGYGGTAGRLGPLGAAAALGIGVLALARRSG